GVALGYPIYVINIDASTNQVMVGEKDALLKRTLIANQINVLSDRLATAHDLPCTAKIRYNHTPQPATVTRAADDELHVTFTEPQSAITPGQAVVLFDGEVVLGGGWIEEVVA